MFKIEKLNFDQICYVERCTLVPHGKIVQTSFNGQTVIGMRTFYNDAMGGGEAIMMMGGADHALLASLEILGNPPAVMVTKLVQFVATNIVPFNPLHKAPEVGSLLQQPDGALITRTVISHPNNITHPAYIYLTNGKTDALKGTCVQTLSFVNLRGISRSFELELRPEPMNIVATT